MLLSLFAVVVKSMFRVTLVDNAESKVMLT